MKDLLKKAVFSAYVLVNRVVGGGLERAIAPVVKSRQVKPVAPVFIIGAPRSGTTLTFQIITQSFRVGYLTNLHCLFFGLPAIVSFFTRNRACSTDFTSDYGRTTGSYGPSECGEWWYRFFPRDPVYVTRSDISSRSKASFRRSLMSIAAVEKRPVVFKNLYAGMRLGPIVNAFPDALFLHVKRNTVDNALSILEGRMSSQGRYDTWWSVPPPGFKALSRLSPARQVLSQISLINRRIKLDVDRLGVEHRVFSANYEDICRDPAAFVNRFHEFAQSRGVDVEVVGTPPKSFEIQRKVTIPADMYEELLLISEREMGQ